jgi:hypothetical protein
VFRRCRNPYRGIATSQNADGTLAERVIRARIGDLAQLDALEIGLVADVELHPGTGATHQVNELLAALDAELGEDAINVSLHRPHRDRKPFGDLTVG